MSERIRFESSTGAGQHGRWAAFFLVALAASIRVAFLFVTRNASTDAWARYQIALNWLHHPGQVPSEVWLPLHFWLLGAVLEFHNSELTVRLATLFLGALTVLPFWALVRRVFDSRVAIYSSVVFACFGMHVGYSTTTGSEVPTIFFMVTGLYGWARYKSEENWRWGVFSGAALSAACLCRFEPWVLVAVLVPLTASFGGCWQTNFGRDLRRVVIFLSAASTGAVGWSLFSWWKWGSPFASAHATMVANATYPIQHSMAYRLAAVPVTLLAALSPVIVGLALVGIYQAVASFPSIRGCLALAALALSGSHFLNSALHSVTQARYTLIYSWLLIPFAFQALYALEPASNRRTVRKSFLALALFFVVWQAGIAVVAEYGPCSWGDKLGRLSPLMPFPFHLRELMAWVGTHAGSYDSVVVDNFNYEADDILRFALPGRIAFKLPFTTDNSDLLQRELAEFIGSERPKFIVYSADGQLGRMWPLADQPAVEVNVYGNDLHLRRLWQNADYRVYAVEYKASSRDSTNSLDH
jgi:Dolichyl-phosphate-mannose-protein mannosyltransferase